MKSQKDACSFFDPSNRYHRNKLEKLIPKIMYWRKLQAESGELELNSTWLQNNVFSNQLGKKFKDATLVVICDSYSNFTGSEFCMKYNLNKNNIECLLKSYNEYVQKSSSNNSNLSVNQSTQSSSTHAYMLYSSVDDKIDHWIIQYYKKKYAAELKGEAKFVYEDKSSRLWHEMQRLPRAIKTAIFEDHLPYDYDASTALISYMLEDLKKMNVDIDQSKYNLIYEYRDNKAEIRNKVAELLDLDMDTVKELFSYLNNKGILSSSPKKGLLKICKKSYKKVEMIKDNVFFRTYVRQIKSLWSIWLSKSNLMSVFKEHARPVIDRKKRYNLYFCVERNVLDQVINYLSIQNLTFFLEHDGFRSSKEINLSELHSYIKQHLQYDLIFSS